MKFRKYLSSFLIASMLLANVTPGYAMTGTHFLDRMPDNSLVIGTTAFDVEDRSSEGFNLNNTINAVKTIENDEANHMYFKVENKWFDLVKGKGEVEKGTIANNVVLFKGVSEPTEYMEVVSKDSEKDDTKTIIEVKKSLDSKNYRKYRVYDKDDFILPSKEDLISGTDWKDIPLNGAVEALNGQIIVVVDSDRETQKAVFSGSIVAVVRINSDEVIKAINSSDINQLDSILKSNASILGIDMEDYNDMSRKEKFLEEIHKVKYVNIEEFKKKYNELLIIWEKEDLAQAKLERMTFDLPYVFELKSTTKNTKESRVEEAVKVIKDIINDDQVEVYIQDDFHNPGRFVIILSDGIHDDLKSNVEIKIKDKIISKLESKVSVGYGEDSPFGINLEGKLIADGEEKIKSITVELCDHRTVVGKYKMKGNYIESISEDLKKNQSAIILMNFGNEDRAVWESERSFVPYILDMPNEVKIIVKYENQDEIFIKDEIEYYDHDKFIEVYYSNSFNGVPKIVLKGKKRDNVKIGTEYVEPGVNVLDDKDTNFDIKISYEDRDGNAISKPLDNFTGIIWHIYNTVDSDGNISNPARRKVCYIGDLTLSLESINPRFTNGKVDISLDQSEDNLSPTTENPVIHESGILTSGFEYKYNVLRVVFDIDQFDYLDFEVVNSDGVVIARKLEIDPDDDYYSIDWNNDDYGYDNVEPTYGVEWRYRDEREAFDDSYEGYDRDKLRAIYEKDSYLVSPGEYTFRLTAKNVFDETIVKEKKYTVTEKDIKSANHRYNDDE
jgi:hypothetical protein